MTDILTMLNAAEAEAAPAMNREAFTQLAQFIVDTSNQIDQLAKPMAAAIDADTIENLPWEGAVETIAAFADFAYATARGLLHDLQVVAATIAGVDPDEVRAALADL